jgi:lipooligosaccharide transport system permease protein
MSSVSEPSAPVLSPRGLAGRAGRAFGSRASARLVERHAVFYRQTWFVLASGALEPLFYLLSIGVGVGAMVGPVHLPGGEQLSYRAFVAPGLLATASMNGAMFDSTFNVFFRLKYDKLYAAVLATPIRASEVALGEISWAVLRGGLYSVAFMAVMLVVGLVNSPWAVLELPAALLTSFAIAAAGMVGTTYMRSWQDFEFIALVTLPMFLFSTTFYPLSVYPRPLQVAVECTPLYQSVTILRSLATGTVGPGLLWHVGYLAALGLAGLFIAGRRIGRLLLS